MKLDLAQLLALPGSPCIRLRLTPTEVLEADQVYVEENREALEAFLLSLPGINDGASYKLLKAHCGNNGMLAKAAIALGEVLDLWKMHPPVTAPALWRKSSLYPMILAGSVRGMPSARRVPKPSAGDLEVVATKKCACCEEEMGPADSIMHDLVASPHRDDLCEWCDHARCEPGGPCKQHDASKPKILGETTKKAEDAVGEAQIDALEAFAMRISGGE